LFRFPCQNFILRNIKRSRTTPFKKNKHKKRTGRHVLLRHMPLHKNCSKSSGGAPGIHTRTQLLSRASFQYIHNSGNDPARPNPKPVAKRGTNAFPGDAAGKTQTQAHRLGGTSGRKRRGLVRASEMTLSGASQCSGSGCARGELHSDAIARAAGCLTILQPEPLRTGSHK
jgi:hypothetical protein